jgi:hypothetical protein
MRGRREPEPRLAPLPKLANHLNNRDLNRPPHLCYRYRAVMKTDHQIGCKRQHSGKPGLGLLPSLRHASAPHPSALATFRFQKIGSSGPPPTQFLIANPELEFSSSDRKHSPLIIPNRKFLRVFHSDLAPNFSLLDARHSSLGSHHQALSVALLIYGSAIRNIRK